MYRPSTLLFALALACGAAARSAASPELVEKPLRDWVTETIVVQAGPLGRPTAFIRRDAVRAYILSNDQSLVAEVQDTIANLAAAFGLQHEFTGTNPNLILLHARGVNDGDKPNRAALRALNLPEPAIDTMMETRGWSEGCGAYAFGNRTGGISSGIAAVDSSLSGEKLRSCVLNGLINVFGLRLKSKRSVVALDGYVQYLLLGNVLAACDKLIAPDDARTAGETEKLYVNCAVKDLKMRIAR
jgi:hypothetical protein